MSALLAVRGLRVTYGGVVAIDDVSLQVDERAIVGLIGPNGAGKTTFIDTVTGFTAAAGGTITFGDATFTDVPPHVRARRGLIRTFQSLELFDDLTVRENLLVAAHTPTLRSTVTDAFWPKRHASPEAERWLRLLGLGVLADVLPGELSNGKRHVVSIARALAGEPRLLLLDEPAAGLDPNETAELAATIRRIRDAGVSVLLVDHDMQLVLDVCDTVHVLDYGRVIASGPPAGIRTDAAVIEAYLGQGTHS